MAETEKEETTSSQEEASLCWDVFSSGACRTTLDRMRTISQHEPSQRTVTFGQASIIYYDSLRGNTASENK